MIILSKEQTIILHNQPIAEIGGSEGVRVKMNMELILKRYTNVLA